MKPKIYGPEFDRRADGERLKRQAEIIKDYMLKVDYKTLAEIEGATDFPQASISAQLRHLSHKDHGTCDKDKRTRAASRTWEYRLRIRVGGTKQSKLPYEQAPQAAGAVG